MVAQSLWEEPTKIWFDLGSLHEMEPIPDTIWVTQNLKLDSLET